ncbi:glutathione S-transferase N-terminal domain-containing protein [Aliamphritea ceti]|uniref:glutathione S-transferase N-terminal domain-containing protein n=1 Tax=Aliamphritea ceti TaxID=1524258 RepID=UPI0021C2F7D5|nr:glutathione S-transferase N-terminal domain-containing protein [Aliamphritea ceti]
MFIIRWILGRIILLLNALTPPTKMQRSPEQQAQLDKQTANLSLYQYEACPFCVKVRRAMRRFNLNVEVRDAKRNQDFKAELEKDGGKLKVPCLRIEEQDGVRWMYESGEIIQYLEQNYVK